MNATRTVALLAWLLGARGSVALEHDDAAALEHDAAAAEIGAGGAAGNKSDAATSTGGAGAGMDARADLGTSPELAPERPPASCSPASHDNVCVNDLANARACVVGCKDAGGAPCPAGSTGKENTTTLVCVDHCGACPF